MHTKDTEAYDIMAAPPAKHQAATTLAPKVLLRHSRNTYSAISDVLLEEEGFIDLHCRKKTDPIKGKLLLLAELIEDSLFLARKWWVIRVSDTVFCIGWIAIPAKILRWLGLIRYRRLFWYAYFVHSPSWFPLFRFFRHFDGRGDFYIVNSTTEREFYAKSLGIEPARLLYLPFGDLSMNNEYADTPIDGDDPVDQVAKSGPFFFAGGLSNRDYITLIDTFRSLPHQLVIVCSHLNRELDDLKFPANVIVHRDVSATVFDRFIRQSQACILPLRHDTGASGQGVLLRYMREKKATISNRNGSIEEYIQDGENGILTDDLTDDLAAAVKRLADNPAWSAQLGAAAYETYVSKFSSAAVKKQLKELLYA